MKYLPALDGIRALAVFLVILFHSNVPYMQGGYHGVDVFFVLSGFIITSLLLGEIKAKKKINFLHFYIRRILRLYPALLLMLALVLVGFWIVTGNSPVKVREYYTHAAIAALYMSDFAILWGWMPGSSIIMHTWSLAIEEHYYLLWPAVLQSLRKHFKKGVTAMVGTIYIAAVAWKLFNCLLPPGEALYMRFDLHVSGLLLGGWIAAMRFDGVRIPYYRAALAVSAILFLVFMSVGKGQTVWVFTFGLFAVEIFTALLIYFVVEEGKNLVSRALGSAVPAYLGRISYGLYLFHYPIAAYTRLHHDWTVVLPVTLSLTLLVAALSYYFVERPALKYARKFRDVGTGKPV